MEEEHKYRVSAGSRKAMTSPPLKPPNQPLSKSETCVFGARAADVCSHDGAALGSLFAERGGQELRLAGQVKEAFGESARRGLLHGRLLFVEARVRCRAEHAVDAFFRRERGTFQVQLRSDLFC